LYVKKPLVTIQIHVTIMQTLNINVLNSKWFHNPPTFYWMSSTTIFFNSHLQFLGIFCTMAILVSIDLNLSTFLMDFNPELSRRHHLLKQTSSARADYIICSSRQHHLLEQTTSSARADNISCTIFSKTKVWIRKYLKKRCS
jgi:hypothetical protein